LYHNVRYKKYKVDCTCSYILDKIQVLIFLKFIISVFLAYLGVSYHRPVLSYLRLQFIMLLLVSYLMTRKIRVNVKFNKRLTDEKTAIYNYINRYNGQKGNIEIQQLLYNT